MGETSVTVRFRGIFHWVLVYSYCCMGVVDEFFMSQRQTETYLCHSWALCGQIRWGRGVVSSNYASEVMGGVLWPRRFQNWFLPIFIRGLSPASEVYVRVIREEKLAVHVGCGG